MKKTLHLFLFFTPAFLFSQQIWHVKADAAGVNTGLNWQDAFTNLQSALQVAHYGDDIWVAAGTYKPTAGDDRTATFDLPVGVRLAGGFAGTEALFGERDWENNITLLSGDIGEPGVWEDNSHHIVRIYGGDSLTVLDGFKIMHGRASVFDAISAKPYGGGILVWADLMRQQSMPLIQNCILESNYAYYGGGMACIGLYQQHVAVPSVKNCTFISNRAQSEGAGLFKRGDGLSDHPFLVENCAFNNNYSFQRGGAFVFKYGIASILLKNNSFVADSAFLEGGAVYFSSAYPVQYQIDHCTFSYNYAGSLGGAIANYDGSSYNTTIIIQNSGFYSNAVSGGRGGAFGSVGGNINAYDRFVIDNCRMENNEGGAINISSLCDSTSIRIDRSYFYGNKFTENEDIGACHYDNSGFHKNSNFDITNSTFAFNEGAVSTQRNGNLRATETTIVNCSFLNNGFKPFVKPWRPNFINQDSYRILNSIIWEEETPDINHLFFNRDNSTFSSSVKNYQVENSLINFPGCEYDGVDPCSTNMIYETSPQFVSTDPAMPDLSVSLGSPVINKGSNAVVDSFGLSYDILGNPRIRQDTVDMGAYELDASSSIADPFFEKESFLLQVRPNLLSAGEPIEVVLFNLSDEKNFVIRLIGVDGREWQRSVQQQEVSQIPKGISISSRNLPAGMYLLLVEDEKGRRKTEKIILK